MNTWFSDCYSTGKFVLGGTSSLPAAVKLRISDDPIIQTRYDIQTGGGGSTGRSSGLGVVGSAEGTRFAGIHSASALICCGGELHCSRFFGSI